MHFNMLDVSTKDLSAGLCHHVLSSDNKPCFTLSTLYLLHVKSVLRLNEYSILVKFIPSIQ